jgi:predicted 3-demethylubiquinone-9 3-methyltransferase (glyoxalase superfamily)
MQKITTFLWFDQNAEEAVNFYSTVFKDFQIGNISRYGENQMMPAGLVMTINFKLFGIEYTALNGGPVFKFSQAISFVINCENQEEIDYYWDILGKDGTYQECGWLIDKYGISWQIVPVQLGKLMSNGNPEKSNNVMQALWKMKKLDINTLEKAFNI